MCTPMHSGMFSLRLQKDIFRITVFCTNCYNEHGSRSFLLKIPKFNILDTESRHILFIQIILCPPSECRNSLSGNR